MLQFSGEYDKRDGLLVACELVSAAVRLPSISMRRGEKIQPNVNGGKN